MKLFEVKMPSTSKKQEKFMRAVAHSKEFAKKVDAPQAVGRDFEAADKKNSKEMIKKRYGDK